MCYLLWRNSFLGCHTRNSVKTIATGNFLDLLDKMLIEVRSLDIHHPSHLIDPGDVVLALVDVLLGRDQRHQGSQFRRHQGRPSLPQARLGAGQSPGHHLGLLQSLQRPLTLSVNFLQCYFCHFWTPQTDIAPKSISLESNPSNHISCDINQSVTQPHFWHRKE